MGWYRVDATHRHTHAKEIVRYVLLVEMNLRRLNPETITTKLSLNLHASE